MPGFPSLPQPCPGSILLLITLQQTPIEVIKWSMHDLKLSQERLRLDIRKRFFRQWVVRH